MSTVMDWISVGLAAAGVFFFAAGSIGLIRLPDVYSRLHALSKADNVGLGLIVLAAMLQADTWRDFVKLGLIWILVLIASACLCVLIAREARRHGIRAERRDGS